MNMREILNLLNIQHFDQTGHHHARSGWLQVDCPYCGKGSGKFHFGFRVNGSKISNCYRCGPHSTLHALIELSHQPFKLIKELLGDLAVDFIKPIERRGELKPPVGVGPMYRNHRKYLISRGFDPDDLETFWGIKGIGVAPKLSWRIYIPIHHRGEIVSWTTRSIADGGTRYLSAGPNEESMNHKELLFGEDYAQHAIVIHEGPFDVFRTGPGAVATFGLAITRAQLLRMSKYPVRAICFDSDNEAQKRARKLMKLLAPFSGNTYNVTLAAKDAGSASSSEIAELRSQFLD